MVSDQIEREVTIAAPVERVWSLLTEAEHVGDWFGDAGAEIDLRPGGALRLSWKEHGTALARIETVEPTSRFAYRWEPASTTGNEPSPEHSTHVEFTLTADGDETRLRVVERGFAKLAVDEPERERLFGGNTEGWAIELGHLVEYAHELAVR